MSEVIERVARALCKARYMNGGIESDDGWDSLPEKFKPDLFVAARAAIEAMREPIIKAVLAARYTSENKYTGRYFEDFIPEVIGDAIDAALETKE